MQRPSPPFHREKSIASSEDQLRPRESNLFIDKNTLLAPEPSRNPEGPVRAVVEREKVEDMEEGEIPRE